MPFLFRTRFIIDLLILAALALFCGDIFVFHAYLAAIVAFDPRSRAELAAGR